MWHKTYDGCFIFNELSKSIKLFSPKCNLNVLLTYIYISVDIGILTYTCIYMYMYIYMLCTHNPKRY